MKALKIIAILIGIYVGLVVAFESLLGYFQPQGEENLVLISQDGEGNTYNRVLTRIELDDKVYVAVNHWPRAWYNRIKDHPDVQVTFAGTTTDNVAVPVTDTAEADTVRAARPTSLMFRVLTGFPPRYFVRLDPAQTGS
jgi:hypothetical protein